MASIVTTSIYPRAVPAFRTHQNLLDDVDANDINLIQREVSALAQIVGTNPQIYNDISIAQVTTTATPGDEGGLDPDTSFTTTLRYYDPDVKAVDHGTVGNRLDNIERGTQVHCFKVAASAINLPSGNVNLDVRPRGIRFPKPAAAYDPNGMYNGVGVTLRKSGFWTIEGTVVVSLLGTAAQNDGIYQATIDRSETWLEGMDRRDVDVSKSSIILNPQLSGFMNRGDRITLRIQQNSGRAQRIRLARMSGFVVRET